MVVFAGPRSPLPSGSGVGLVPPYIPPRRVGSVAGVFGL